MEVAAHVELIRFDALRGNFLGRLTERDIQRGRDALGDRQRWVLPLEGAVRSGTDSAGAGECLLLEPGDELECESARMLIGAMP